MQQIKQQLTEWWEDLTPSKKTSIKKTVSIAAVVMLALLAYEFKESNTDAIPSAQARTQVDTIGSPKTFEEDFREESRRQAMVQKAQLQQQDEELKSLRELVRSLQQTPVQMTPVDTPDEPITELKVETIPPDANRFAYTHYPPSFSGQNHRGSNPVNAAPVAPEVETLASADPISMP